MVHSSKNWKQFKYLKRDNRLNNILEYYAVINCGDSELNISDQIQSLKTVKILILQI